MLLDTTSPQFRHDPYPTYAALRETEPVSLINEPVMGQAWLVTRYDDVVTVLKDPRFSNEGRKTAAVQRKAPWWTPKVLTTFQNSMLLVDDPDHRRLRDLVHKAFTPKMLQGLNKVIENVTDERLEKMARKKSVDLIADFALPIPLTVISDMMGVPVKDRLKFHHWMGTFLEIRSGTKLQMMGKMLNMMQMYRFFKSLINLRRRQPQDDLITALVNAEQDGDRLNEDEMIAMIFLLLLAGHETTVNLIGNGTLALLENPDQLHKLQNQPELIDSAVEELLRFTNPVEQPAPRYNLEEIELGGQKLPRGSRVLVSLASANRDEAAFPNADKLDITRTPNKHLAFGLGIHYCLGAPLARMEGKIGLQRLITRFPNMQLGVKPDAVQWRTSMAVRGLKALPIVVE
ncbi:MAG: cytochrome P450 [Chloroflexi bacterium]|nr:cytochrome P450 [Chloroflexota bacterium]